ncbi:hypothetical protein BVG19_g2458 [[Candida] boidinii]|nr:hypothetical protein BVG19_g2458 [[Candida] boidinii]OWB52898.1 hypothetical protein B5S27_g4481 [[Candida] boidinii]OWB83826.1 hypothetical protein B5S33_g2460 [[Candida] boidinii]
MKEDKFVDDGICHTTQGKREDLAVVKESSGYADGNGNVDKEGDNKLIHFIISESGISAWKIQNDELWTVSINIIAWKEVFEDDNNNNNNENNISNSNNGNQGMSTKNIRIRKTLMHSDYIKILRLIKKDKVNAIRIKLINNNSNDEFKGQLIDVYEYEYTDEEVDKELNQFLEEYKKPIVFTDESLGCLFEYDKEIECYNGKIDWIKQGEKIGITLNIPIDKYQDFKVKIDQIINNKIEWKSKYEKNIIDDLLELKNKEWIDEDDILDSDCENNGENIKLREIGEKEFLHRIKLTNISINFDLTVEFWFDDGDLFFGHAICCYGDLKDGSISSSEILG